MALTDILRGAYRTAQNVVRPAVLGLALAYCGPTIEDDREGCRDDNDCSGGRVCEYDRSTGERYCISKEQTLDDRMQAEVTCSGEVLFEDDFDGRELDLEMWDAEPCDRQFYRLNDGVVELTAAGDRQCNLWSSPRTHTYTLPYRPLCFEARWRVSEREGTGFILGLVGLGSSGSGNSVFFLVRRTDASEFCRETVNGELYGSPCEVETTEWNKYEFIATQDYVQHYLNGKMMRTTTRVPTGSPLFLTASCQSESDYEKSCQIDYIRFLLGE